MGYDLKIIFLSRHGIFVENYYTIVNYLEKEGRKNMNFPKNIWFCHFLVIVVNYMQEIMNN